MTDDERCAIATIALETADAAEASKLISREFPNAQKASILAVLDENEPFLRSQGLGTFDALRREIERQRKPRRVISAGDGNSDD
jgi:hypothetical protein